MKITEKFFLQITFATSQEACQYYIDVNKDGN